jgi:hypothetical protein
MKALKLYTAVSTLALAGCVLLGAMGPARAETNSQTTFHAEQLGSTIIQSNVNVASQLATGPGQLAAIFQTIVQTGVNINLNALLWNFPTDQLTESALFGDLSFMNESPLAELMESTGWVESLSEPPAALAEADPEPSIIQQTIVQSGMNCNISVRTLRNATGFSDFDDVEQSNTNVADQTAICFWDIVHVEQTVQQMGFNFNSTGIFSEIPHGDDWIPTLMESDIDSLQSSPLMQLVSGGGGPSALLDDPRDPTLLIFQTIVQTGVNFNLNILNVISDQPAPETPDAFLQFFPMVTQSNTNVATQLAAVVPEPGSLALLAMGLSALSTGLRRRRGAAAGRG